MKKSKKCMIAWVLAAVMALTSGSSVAFANEAAQPEKGEAVKVEAEQPDVSVDDEASADGENQTEESDNVRLGAGADETYYYEYELEFDSESQDPTVFDGESITVYAKPVDGSPVPPTEYSFEWKVGTYDTEDETTTDVIPVKGVTFEPINNGTYDGVRISTEKGCFDEESLVFIIVEATLRDNEGEYVESYYNSFAGRCVKASFD